MSQTPIKVQVIEFLRDVGVQYIFGNPGSTEVPLLDTLVDHAEPRYLLALHESIAMAMGDAYAQLTRKPAVVSVHATPGTTNVMGGLFLAQSHRSPVVVLAGQQDSRLLSRRPFLASDLGIAAHQYVKWVHQMGQPEEVVPALEYAFEVATTPPEGPVLLIIPRDFYEATGDPIERPWTATEPHSRSDDEDLARAVDVILHAQRLVIMSGNGVGRAGEAAIDAVVELAELLGARVHSEHNATNVHFPSGHPQYLGGNAHGTAPLRSFLADADLVVAIGCDLFMEEHYEPEPLIPAGCAVVQLDDDPTEIGRLVDVEVGLPGNLTETAGSLLSRLSAAMDSDDHSRAAERRTEVVARRGVLDEDRERTRRQHHDDEPLHMTRVYSELRDVMGDRDIMVDEAVTMASYLHDFFEFRHADTFLSSKQSWLGWGWGAALGAQLSRPKRKVVAVLGDGSASYTPQALWTAQRCQIPILAVIVNNGRYMAVENHLYNYAGQSVAHREYVGTELGGIDFVALAHGFGVVGERVSSPQDLGAALKAGYSSDEPRLIEIMMDPNDAGLGRIPIPRPQPT